MHVMVPVGIRSNRKYGAPEMENILGGKGIPGFLPCQLFYLSLMLDYCFKDKIGVSIWIPISLSHLSAPPSSLQFCFAMASVNRWVRPEVYPLFAAVGVAVGICGFQLARNLTINPEVRINKEGRAAGVLDNHAEGKKYAEHGLRHFVRNKAPEIMPSLNSFFSDPK
ncbi:B12d-like protein [Rhynchospora pubera]|uniref:B12d-like protein n=1 Tax=Rhynchospora pubera TaxID=906938 RepID=A0AAV8CPF6_9POAL|nr:B12d-like protein [Rhynchospora pubera]